MTRSRPHHVPHLARRSRRVHHRAACSLVAFACVLLSAAIAPAQSQGGDADARAQELFQKGRTAIVYNKFLEAYEPLRQAWALKKSYDIAALLGQTELELGKFRDAAEHLAASLESYPPTGKQDARRRIEELFRKAKQRVAKVSVAADKDGAELLLDGKVIGRSPLGQAIFVEPGLHELEARLEGHETARAELDAKAGAEASVTLAMKASSPAPAKALPGNGRAGDGASGSRPGSERPGAAGETGQSDSAPAGKPSLVPAMIGGGVAIAGLGAALVFRAKASSADDDASAAAAKLPGGNPCGAGTSFATECAELERANEDFDKYRNWSTAGFITFGAGAAFTAGYLIWRGTRPERGPGAKLAPALAASPRAASISVVGSF